MKEAQTVIAFAGTNKIASGFLKDVAGKVKAHLQSDSKSNILIFDDNTSRQVEIDLRGSLDSVLKRLETPEAPETKIGPGRPKLGVISKEITLLPHHWEWLGAQPGGASVTLRKLVEDAKKKNSTRDQLRNAQEATYKFMLVMAGDLENYEEALRALYAKDSDKFSKQIKTWPKDVRTHITKLAKAIFE